jgi:hypothetical protein
MLTMLVCALATVLPGRLAAEDPALVDLRCTVLARKTLADDKELEPLNLAVRVQNRVATLMGPVPSSELGRRAVARLARLPELTAVRNELFVDTDAAAILGTSPPAPPPAKGGLRKVPAAVSPPKVPAKTTAAGAPPTPAAAPLAPAPAVPPAAGGVEPAVRRLIQGDERYRRLRVQVRDGNVHLGGAVYRWEDVHELSRALGRIPGVNRIILHEIDPDPTGR